MQKYVKVMPNGQAGAVPSQDVSCAVIEKDILSFKHIHCDMFLIFTIYTFNEEYDTIQIIINDKITIKI